MYTTVIFDLDGTLLNTLDDLMDSTNMALEAYGFPKRSHEEIRCFVGNGIRKLMRGQYLIIRILPIQTRF